MVNLISRVHLKLLHKLSIIFQSSDDFGFIFSHWVVLQVQLLRENLEEVNLLCGVRLSQRQETVHTLEMELQELRVSLQQSQGRYSVLLELRTKLEAEIAEYRRLLGGEHQEKKRWGNWLITSALIRSAAGKAP